MSELEQEPCKCGSNLTPYKHDPERWWFCERCGYAERRRPPRAPWS